MRTTTIPPADLELLRSYDTPTICNVIELFHVRPRTAGYLDGRIRACFPEMPPMAGFALTATYRAAAPPKEGSVYASLDRQVAAFVDVPSPPVVVFQDLDDPPVAATFGEVMCTAYKSFGAAGLITSGAARDLDQVRRLGFPCFSSGVICSHGYVQFLDINVPVRVGGVVIHPGDLLHGDANGVTTIPLEVASEVAKACAEYVAAEQVVLDYSKSGQVTVAGFAEARAECGRRIAALSERVRPPR
ncbi:MAG: RraA family protein [Acidobacteria bacterium]|nr:RraA family protein [Acidobacteriota bacterium]